MLDSVFLHCGVRFRFDLVLGLWIRWVWRD